MGYLRTLIAALLVAAPLPALSNGLIPLTDRDDLFGWEAVGRIDIAGGGYCTGVLIATDVVLTAAHCMYDRATGIAIKPADFSFSAGLQNGVAIETRTVRHAVPHQGYRPEFGVTQKNVRFDVALLKLDKPISSFTAAPFALHSGLNPGNSVSVVSYGRGRDAVLSWQKNCDVLDRARELMAFNCNVTYGSSGAPVFVKEGNRARIVSLVSSGRNTNGKTVAYGMELPRRVEEVKRTLRRVQVASSGTNGVKRIVVGGTRSQIGAKFIKN